MKREHKKVCDVCYKDFNSKRVDANYCSSDCRVKAHRAKNKPKSKQMVIVENVLKEIVPFYADEILVAINKKITSA